MMGHGVRGVTFALAAALLVAASGVSITAAQAQQQAAQGQFSFDIPAKPVPQAVNDIGRVAGLSVVFRENRPISAIGNPVSGSMTAGQALSTMLAGTKLDYSFSNPTTVQVFELPAPTFDNTASADGVTVLDVITIYGARNTTTLESTSASVGVVTAREIEAGQIRTTRESFRRLANVMDSANLDSGFVIRGMSSEGFVPSGALVGSLYVDGVLQTRYGARRGARNLWDVEQVEVYRGPQSTLSGRAAMSGAIYVKTKDPTFDQQVEVSGTVGNNDLAGTAFMVNTPVLDDQIAIRIAGAFERSKTILNYPDYEIYDNHGKFTTDVGYNLRGKILFAPSEMPETRGVLSYAFSNDRPIERLIGTGAGFDPDDNRGDWYQYPVYAEHKATKVHNIGLEVTHDFTDALRLTSQSGLHIADTDRFSIDLGTVGNPSGLNGNIDDKLFMQELRLNYEGDRWKWVGGVYGSYQNFDSWLEAGLYPVLRQAETLNRKTTNLAAFGEATYEFFPTWNFTLGGRVDYTREKSVQVSSRWAWAGTPNPTENRADFDELNFVPKVGLSKDLAEGHTVGATYSQGFRTGGYFVNYVTLEPNYYDPEKAHSYELFYKGRLLDDRLTLNANLFYTKYQDQQIEIRPDPNDQFYRETSNAASSRAWGFEIEPTFQVNERLSLFASVGYLNTKFEEFNHASYGDLSGQPFPEAPEWTIGFGGRYEFENGFYVGGDAKYTYSHLARFGQAPQDKLDSRIIVNAQAGYRRDNWEINVFAENLLDERYYTFADQESLPAYAQLGPWRSFGVNVKTRW
ncbi:TonB-dependent receptor [Mesorhizobium sp. SB112]|uniref:TonB-dependent receptor n=1 Tax=Mesorhizobium sp. SB112 TaxID=3151853 RepID=UPI003264C3A3